MSWRAKLAIGVCPVLWFGVAWVINKHLPYPDGAIISLIGGIIFGITAGTYIGKYID
jgi:hypothetical protein